MTRRPRPQVVDDLAGRLAALGWVSDLLVAGSLATGDWTPSVSDLDLVAVTAGPVGTGREQTLSAVHRDLDAGSGAGLKLGCVYVDTAALDDPAALHPTWTHGALVHRILSGVTRAELALHGFAVLGRAPAALLSPVTPDDVRAAARSELTGYWALAARHPLWFLDPVLADLALTSMARGRHSLATGELLTKTLAVEQAHAPAHLVAALRARRRGEDVTSPRLRTALVAWRDVRRTVAAARRPAPASP
ncbi:nucleotidyltransferase domain-containing protein [Kineosporia sp. A_224]|uniref:nucleotidyltransferase domain-containing protein n=1 Tax=Kineosporia sp. A_224 TaxID=1962180 RepID=UPI0018E90BC6|nr:nucleotidyltransferase domain-containing protein [Kineosporia sp. A_224]